LEDLVKTYKLSRATLIFIYGLLGFVSLIGVIAIFQGFRGGVALSPAQPFFIVWLGVLAWVWFIYGRIPVTITWRDEGVLEFKSLIATTQVPVEDVIAIKATPLSWGFIKITYQGGSLRLLCQITGLYELLGAVKAKNPGVEIVGC
jgi:voltage-gated potassium channel Kch